MRPSGGMLCVLCLPIVCQRLPHAVRRVPEEFAMSTHRSLKIGAKIRKKRNVLKRFERIDILKDDGRLKEGDKVWGLPKTKAVE
jgi:small basic protein (TIGR04137 family)